MAVDRYPPNHTLEENLVTSMYELCRQCFKNNLYNSFSFSFAILKINLRKHSIQELPIPIGKMWEEIYCLVRRASLQTANQQIQLFDHLLTGF